MGDRITRKEAMAILGHDPNNYSSITEFVKKGALTVYWGLKRDPTQRGRKRVQYFDLDEVQEILRKRQDANPGPGEFSEASRKAITPSGPGGVQRNLAGRFAVDAQQQEERKRAREEFLRETLTDAQTRALLGVGAWDLMKLAENGQIRTRKMMGEERYERADVLAEQARRDSKKT